MSYLTRGLKLVFPVGDHASNDFDMFFLFGLQVLIRPPFSNFFLGIGRGIFQKGLVTAWSRQRRMTILSHITCNQVSLITSLLRSGNGGFLVFLKDQVHGLGD